MWTSGYYPQPRRSPRTELNEQRFRKLDELWNELDRARGWFCHYRDLWQATRCIRAAHEMFGYQHRCFLIEHQMSELGLDVKVPEIREFNIEEVERQLWEEGKWLREQQK